ncbi:hypothetical protein Nepgr_001378 [Nepenthes gracilis]|uniref:Uncharacterized protein n=1 Tax=Nepenthes gracilis TaxID=150966 RepID=A0AAD3RWZ0_NEPGR|nr:hypothetical protein Nepgr_001378 [Nepenthes gracilis]
MAKSFLFSTFSCLLLALSVNARPGLHFHPCNIVIVSTYSFRPSNPNFPNHFLDHRQGFFAVVAEVHEFDQKPEKPLQLERPRFVFDKTDVGRPNSNFLPSGVSSLRDLAMDILNVVASLLFGAACGALTAGAMYFIWLLFNNRHDDSYHNLDGFSSDEDDDDDDDNDDIFNPKKPSGYVAIPAAAPADSAAAPAPAKETA